MEVVNDVADRFGFRHIQEHEVDTLRGYDARRMMRHLRTPAWKLPLIARHMRRRMAADIHRIPLFPGTDALLRHLHAHGVAIGIVTSNSEANVRRLLGPELAGLVRHYGCGASILGKRSKLRRVLRASGVPAAEAVKIGDEIRGRLGVHARGGAGGARAGRGVRDDGGAGGRAYLGCIAAGVNDPQKSTPHAETQRTTKRRREQKDPGPEPPCAVSVLLCGSA
jgi:phosphoglycolate phosphatase